jgi:hypothetical protein
VGETDQDDDERNAARLRDIIENGSELTGATAGALVGLIGGPPGAVAGAAAGVVITKALRRVGLEVHDRLLVAHQQERVGAALGVMSRDAADALATGEHVRTDGFFDTPPGGRRADADEVLEGTLRAAADAYEECKLRHIAAIFPSVALRDDISAGDAHWLVKTAERLSWRQMVVLSIIADPPAGQMTTQRLAEREEGGRREPRGRRCASGALAEEVEDLGHLGLLGQRLDDGTVLRAGTTMMSVGDFWTVPMADWTVTASGALLCSAARLDEIAQGERTPVVEAMLDQGDADHRGSTTEPSEHAARRP